MDAVDDETAGYAPVWFLSAEELAATLLRPKRARFPANRSSSACPVPSRARMNPPRELTRQGRADV